MANLTIRRYELFYFTLSLIRLWYIRDLNRRDSMRITPIIAALALLFSYPAQSQSSSSEIQKKLQRLNSFGRVMYIAAHPDDENTRVISWLSQGLNAEVRYLSLTRGSGGQNMIGTELGPELGVLRTEELLAARSIDGGSQRFTQAVDFGYSKTAEESMEIWDKEEVLNDVVRAIREFRPDIILTRFPPDSRGGHGHHTASAILALEAFELAGDPNYLNAMNGGIPHQPKAIYWNTYSWRWDPNLDSLATNDPKYFKANVGGYDPILGQSYNEIGSHARSQHRCQGFGVSISRGDAWEYFAHMNGEMVEEEISELFPSNWGEYGASVDVAQKAMQVQSNFDPSNPAASVQDLFELYEAIHREEMYSSDIPKIIALRVKLDLVKDLILDCLGLYGECITDQWSYSVNPSGNRIVSAQLRLIARNMEGVSISMEDETFENPLLPKNEFAEFDVEVNLGPSISQPYWLKDISPSADVQERISSANAGYTGYLNFAIEYGDFYVPVSMPVTHRWSDRVDGEQRRPTIVAPGATATFNRDVAIFSTDAVQTVQVRVKSFEENFTTKVGLQVPEGWSYSPKNITLNFSNLHEEKVVTFTVTPPSNASEAYIRPTIEGVSGTIQQFSEIAYPHIPTQVVFGESRTKVVRLDMSINAGTIGYIQGAGDEVDVAIEQMGFDVVRLEESDLASIDLNQFQAVVVGIRAYNVHPWLLNYREKLFNYVEEGGHLIVQYNTATRDLLTSELGPYPFSLSRNRVTEEDAEVTLLNEDHPFFTSPNQINTSDFENWVQERGLYFASEWSDDYEALISWHDEGEQPQNGGLLYAEYGDGHFTYTGISFFRELPAGVPGAFKLLANILSHE